MAYFLSRVKNKQQGQKMVSEVESLREKVKKLEASNRLLKLKLLKSKKEKKRAES